MARTAAFATLAFAELWRSSFQSVGALGLVADAVSGNPKLILAILSSAMVVLAVLFIPPLAQTFKTAKLSRYAWGL